MLHLHLVYIDLLCWLPHCLHHFTLQEAMSIILIEKMTYGADFIKYQHPCLIPSILFSKMNYHFLIGIKSEVPCQGEVEPHNFLQGRLLFPSSMLFKADVSLCEDSPAWQLQLFLRDAIATWSWFHCTHPLSKCQAMKSLAFSCICIWRIACTSSLSNI